MPSSIRGATKPPHPYAGGNLYGRQANASTDGTDKNSYNNLRTPQNQAGIGML